MLSKRRAPTHPGEILKVDFLQPLGLSQTEFANHLGWTYARLNEIIKGKRGISADSALSFSEALNTTPEFWLNLQRNCDLWHALRKHTSTKAIKKAS